MQLQCFQDLAVRLVYGRCVQRGEINSRGLFRIVPHCFADGRKRNVPASGDGSPPVTGDVARQGYVQSQSHTQLFQFVIYQMRRILVLPAGVGIHVFNHRQQIGSADRILFVDNFLHGFFPFDEQLLSRFLPAIREYAVLQVFLLQISHIDERHSPGVE